MPSPIDNAKLRLAQILAYKLKVGQQLNDLVGAVGLGMKSAGPVLGQRLGMVIDQDPVFAAHDANDADTAESHYAYYGGWNRPGRDAKGFQSAADMALRYPNRANQLKILAGVHQGRDMIQAPFRSDTTIQDEYRDLQANLAGINAVSGSPMMSPDSEQTKAYLSEQARAYADAIRARKPPK